MNKGELIDAIAEKAHVTKKDADSILSATLDLIVESVASGEKVSLVGFGTFEKRDRAAREGRNPKTGETLSIAATTVPAFSAGKSFKESVAGEKAKAAPAPDAKAKGKGKK
ncbi:MAG: HU family DNA-binding protein [Thermosynechococcaceae cyanobacterium MS004]|nr:HU family DNA-binding protein [Thermosynechococcaceae cyanobacterium MS004]